MSSQPVTFTPPAGSEAQNTAEPGVQQSVTTSDDDRPMTRKEFREGLDQWNLTQLKLRQKLEGRAKKAAATEAERLKSEGVTVTPDQEHQLFSVALNALNQDETTETAPAMPGQSQSAGSQPIPSATPETIAAVALLKALKLPMINQDDEEAKLVDLSDGEKYLETIEKAARAKATRLANPPGSRVPSLGSGSGAASLESLTAELVNVQKNWHGTAEEVKKSKELREKIKQLTP